MIDAYRVEMDPEMAGAIAERTDFGVAVAERTIGRAEAKRAELERRTEQLVRRAARLMADMQRVPFALSGAEKARAWKMAQNIRRMREEAVAARRGNGGRRPTPRSAKEIDAERNARLAAKQRTHWTDDPELRRRIEAQSRKGTGGKNAARAYVAYKKIESGAEPLSGRLYRFVVRSGGVVAEDALWEAFPNQAPSEVASAIAELGRDGTIRKSIRRSDRETFYRLTR